MFDDQVETEKRINLLYDEVSKHYHLMNSVTDALSRKYVCKGCNKGCERGVTHRCQERCRDYVSSAMSIRRCSNPVRDVIDSLGVAHVLINTRRRSWEKSLYANRR